MATARSCRGTHDRPHDALRRPRLPLRAAGAGGAAREAPGVDHAACGSDADGAEASRIPGAQPERRRPDPRARRSRALRIERHHGVSRRRLPRAAPLSPRSLGARAGEDVAGVRAGDGEGFPAAHVCAGGRTIRPPAASRRGAGRRAALDRRPGPPRLGAAGLRRRGRLGRRGAAPGVAARPAARPAGGGARRSRLARRRPLLDRRPVGGAARTDVPHSAAPARAGAAPPGVRLARPSRRSAFVPAERGRPAGLRSMDRRYDVAIVGYGPVGQTLAILLAQRGWKVGVFAQQPAAYPLPRAVHFDHEVARILQAAGLGDELPRLTEPADTYEWRNAAGETLLVIRSRDTSLSGWPEANMFAQPELERALDTRVRALPSVEVHRAAEVVDIGPALVVASPTGERHEVGARWIVGCDGANSFVRRHLGSAVTDLGFFFD